MHPNLSHLESFFTYVMPATKNLIEEMWQVNRPELVSLLHEYMSLMGANAFGYSQFKDMADHAEVAPHAYPNPWKTL